MVIIDIKSRIKTINYFNSCRLSQIDIRFTFIVLQNITLKYTVPTLFMNCV